MDRIQSFQQFNQGPVNNTDFIGMWAQKLGMSREEYVAHYASPTIGSGIDEAEEVIQGGISGSMSIEDIAKHHGVDLRELIDQYEKGIEVELEHTEDKGMAAEIARDHLYEDPEYYTKLAKMEEAIINMVDEADHEVGMAQGQLAAIANAVMDLQEKIGNEEKDLPGWIQDHISQAYNYIKQANDNFHELEEAEQIDEALKMLMAPLMLKIMKQFGFNRDPQIKAELRQEIQAAIEEVLRRHDIIVEQ